MVKGCDFDICSEFLKILRGYYFLKETFEVFPDHITCCLFLFKKMNTI